MTPRTHLMVADAVWMALIVATLLSAWLIDHQAVLAGWTVPVLMLVVAIKVHGVVASFMEMVEAPVAWRLAFAAWILGTTGMIAVLHWMTARG